MKRTITSVLALVLTTGLVAACGSDSSTSSVTTTAAPAAATPATSEAATTTGAAPTPEVLTIQIVDEKPVGGVAKLKVKKGDQVHFIVDSDSELEVHLHGYDIAKDAAPGAPAEFDFEATIDGVFEAELEHPGVQILKLTVAP